MFQTEIDADSMVPKDDLTPFAMQWCKGLGCNARTLSDILMRNDEKVLKAIQDGIDRTNKQAVSRAQKIQKWTILPRDFSVPGGELGEEKYIN